VSPARRVLRADAMDMPMLYPLHDSVCGVRQAKQTVAEELKYAMLVA
jgi:hypothetical protein